jgi:two-component system cell cycle sensor histidine kinase PleC
MATLLFLISRDQPMPTRPLGFGWRRQGETTPTRALSSVNRDGPASGPAAETRQNESSAEPELTEADRLAALMAHLNHDLRTPLNAIIGFSDIMQKELLGPLGSERYQNYAQHIRESGLSLLKAVEDTLAMTALLANRDARPTVISLDESVRAVCADVAEKARRKGIVINVVQTSGVRTMGHAPVVRQTLVNVLRAVVADTAADTTVSISTIESADGAIVRIVSCRDQDIAIPDGNRIAGLQCEIVRTLIALAGGQLDVDLRADRVCHTRIAYPIAAGGAGRSHRAIRRRIESR